MCVIIGELSNKLVTIKDSADRPQRYTKTEVIVRKIFFVDRNEKEDIPNQWRIGRKQKQKTKNIGTMMRTIFHFNLLLELFFYDVYGEYLMQSVGLLFDGMTDMLIEAMSKKKIKAASFKELINGWIKLYSIIMRYMLQESVTENGDTEAKAQLMRAITDAVKSDEMDKVTMEVFTISHFLFVLKLLIRKAGMLLQKLNMELM